jgi:Holliday junction resolvase RusA-like endonuclease
VSLAFTIPGPPRGKGRPKFARRGKFTTVYTDDKTASYENLAKLAAERALAGRGPTPDAVDVFVHAVYAIPKSASKAARTAMLSGAIRPTKKPDLDNVVKAVLDGVNGVVFDDDAQVVGGGQTKFYGETPRVEVIVKKADLTQKSPLAA